MALEKAKIEILDKQAIPAGESGIIEVQFNPTEYAITKAGQIAQVGIPGLDSPILQFVRGQVAKLSLELFFDSTEGGMGDDAVSVETMTKPVFELVKIQSKTHAPPRIRFYWGKLSFKAVVDSVNQKFTLFSPTGVPLRATVTVSMLEYESLADQVKRLNLQSSDHTKIRVVRRAETLAGIAAEEYGDPALWRVVADANGSRLPRLRVPPPGTRLVMPPVES